MSHDPDSSRTHVTRAPAREAAAIDEDLAAAVAALPAVRVARTGEHRYDLGTVLDELRRRIAFARRSKRPESLRLAGETEYAAFELLRRLADRLPAPQRNTPMSAAERDVLSAASRASRGLPPRPQTTDAAPASSAAPHPEETA